jgi:hypothetical protein
MMASELTALTPCEAYIAIPGKAGEVVQTLRGDAFSRLPGSVFLAGCHAVQFLQTEALVRLMRQTDCRCLVVYREAEALINTLAESANCPIVVV